MELHKVVGNVTLGRCHPSYQGATLLAVESSGEQILGRNPPSEPDLLIVWDDNGAGIGNQIAVSDAAKLRIHSNQHRKP